MTPQPTRLSMGEKFERILRRWKPSHQRRVSFFKAAWLCRTQKCWSFFVSMKLVADEVLITEASPTYQLVV